MANPRRVVALLCGDASIRQEIHTMASFHAEFGPLNMSAQSAQRSHLRQPPKNPILARLRNQALAETWKTPLG